MRFTKFVIKNFKGIESIEINLDKSPDANIYTLVGLNESGKTTILEAINFFNERNKELRVVELPDSIISDYNSLIPISKRDNFNDVVYIEAILHVDREDVAKINELLSEQKANVIVENVSELKYSRSYKFKDSKYQDADYRWSGFRGSVKKVDGSYINSYDEAYSNINSKLADICRKLLPSILYFPNFLFDFPSKIILNKTDNPKDSFYIELVQDILFSLGNDTNIETHLIERIKSAEKSDRRSLDTLLKKMSRKVTEVVFDAWNRIFKRDIRDAQVVIKSNSDTGGNAYLEFEIDSEDGIYQISERSLGFRWFFTFLLFTQFRPFRKDSPQNVIFLFDEPASNLHSKAQQQLLKSFENLTVNCKIIYTTHSHHLINPQWLESTYVVRNEGVLANPEDYTSKATNISIEPYREFVIKHPHNTAYFQPILDVLDYSPSNLENLPDCIFLEGKNDFYTLEYFNDIIFKDDKKLNLAPSTGSSNLDTLISLYIGWGKEFIILLDSDKQGNEQKKRYIDKFGIIVEQRLYTLADIDASWSKIGMEKLFGENEMLAFQQTCYPEATELNKTHFNRSIQESLVNKKDFPFSDTTKENFAKVLEFLNDKIQALNAKR